MFSLTHSSWVPSSFSNSRLTGNSQVIVLPTSLWGCQAAFQWPVLWSVAHISTPMKDQIHLQPSTIWLSRFHSLSTRHTTPLVLLVASILVRKLTRLTWWLTQCTLTIRTACSRSHREGRNWTVPAHYHLLVPLTVSIPLGSSHIDIHTQITSWVATTLLVLHSTWTSAWRLIKSSGFAP